MKTFPLRPCLALFCGGLAFTSAVADEELVVKAAVAVRFPTDPGQFYQLQVQKDGSWENVGLAIPGTGKPVSGFHPAGEYRVVQPNDQWVKVWADEFEGDQLDLTKWAKEENNYGGGNMERQAYRTEPKYCFVKDGFLNLSVYRDPHTTTDGKTQPYSSARIRTQGRAEWQYGRFEVRAKMPDGEGIWPAVWMLPTHSKYGTWAAGGEIDLIESRGSAVHETTGALHFGGKWPGNKFVAHSYTFPEKNAAEAFHLYTLEWDAEEIRWFVDGNLCQKRGKEEWFSTAAPNDPNAPFDQPFHLIVNVAVDGRFFEKTEQRADRIPAGQFPQTLQIDYIRVWQWAD